MFSFHILNVPYGIPIMDSISKKKPPFFYSPEDGPSVSVPLEMSLGRLLRRASSKASDLLTFNPAAGGASLRSGLDGEIIFSKNNVCVHPAEPLPGLAEHHPGEASNGPVSNYSEVNHPSIF